MAKRYASETKVSVARSRAEIEKLLRNWGADAIRWTDHWRESAMVLEFLWRHEEADYLARFRMEIEEGSGAQVEHRILLLWLKGCFNAVEAGLVEAEVIFLPFLVGTDGQTVAQAALPRLRMLLEGSAAHLLGSGDG